MDKETAENYQAQSDIAQQGIDAQMGMNTPQLFEQVQQNQAILVEQTNPKKIVDEIIMRLRGKKVLPNGVEIKIAEPKMNEKGIEKMMFILDSHINQNIILSHLNKEEISVLMKTLSNDLVDNLALNQNEFEIRDKTDLDDINNSILTNIYMALKRAEGQNEKNWLGKISIENISPKPSFQGQKRGGFWEKFKF